MTQLALPDDGALVVRRPLDQGQSSLSNGELSARIRLESLVADARMLEGGPALQILISDGSVPARQLYASAHPSDIRPELALQRQISIAGASSWSVTAIPSTRYLDQYDDQVPLLVLLFGLTLTLLAHVGLRQLLHRSQEVERLVEQRTRELGQALERLNTLAATDDLTALANRRHFDDCLQRECRRSIRDFTPLTLMMVDVDCFKAYNDHYGHPAGDRCLQQIARALGQTVARPGDLVARYGGEEFALLLPATNENAQDLAERCRRHIRDLAIPHEYSEVDSIVTISVGLCTLQPSSALKPEFILERADRALYRAKGNGRDRVEADIETAPAVRTMLV
ncbi:hypothetical protein GCM10011348_14400 [Marinobacterium nitratireducens]|uniref:diguanylate cyclase n=1 Tax=Marinobacterium nitratireducens TaxID=518897 RepID=A0A918DR49_9GAMM|nr:hypothetical protein GCM10011348_14400 [Marinobacterium nitratireducens]